jgi:hypothetical protein
VAVSANYDHIYVSVPGGLRTLDPLTIQLEFSAPYRHRLMPRAEVGAGFYDFGSVSSVVSGFDGDRPRTSREMPFGMNFGAGLFIPLWGPMGFDADLRYHQTMGSSSYVLGTAQGGVTYRWAASP